LRAEMDRQPDLRAVAKGVQDGAQHMPRHLPGRALSPAGQSAAAAIPAAHVSPVATQPGTSGTYAE
jgi:hypothetical protein